MRRNGLLLLIVLIISSCGERGRDPEGRFKATLKLQRADKTLHDFYLGGYDSLGKCLGLLKYETTTYERDQHGKFYTNAEMNYGGYKTKDLPIEHLIIGAQCNEDSD